MQELKTNGFIILPYPEKLRTAINTLVPLWRDFCALPPTTKEGIPYSNSSAGIGYELKEGIGQRADKKENFDFTLAGQEWLQRSTVVKENSTVANFVQQVILSVAEIKPLVILFAQQLESTFHLKGLTEEVEKGEDAFFVRFIHYFGGRTAEEEIATAHADQSGFTLHLFESAPGFQCLSREGRWLDVPMPADGAVVISGMQMQLRSRGELKALSHRVVATPETAQNGRYSAVCFVQLRNTPKYDKEKHGRLQEKKPGFNYSMSVAEFKGLFK